MFGFIKKTAEEKDIINSINNIINTSQNLIKNWEDENTKNSYILNINTQILNLISILKDPNLKLKNSKDEEIIKLFRTGFAKINPSITEKDTPQTIKGKIQYFINLKNNLLKQ